MADNKKYYYLKLKDTFFDSDELIVLESMPDGYLYSNILLKLYLRSLKHEGKLMFNDKIPYNPTILAKVTRHSVGTVEKALQIFRDMGLIEVLDSGAIFMNDIQNFIGKSSTEADRQRNYYNRIRNERDEIQVECKKPCKKPYMISTPEIEIEIEKDIEIEKKPQKQCFGTYKHVLLTTEEYQKLQKEYPNTNELITFLDEYIEMKGYAVKNCYLAIKKWVAGAVEEQKQKETKKRKSQMPDYTISNNNYEIPDELYEEYFGKKEREK